MSLESHGMFKQSRNYPISAAGGDAHSNQRRRDIMPVGHAMSHDRARFQDFLHYSVEIRNKINEN
jgi:hypothetical protein